MIDICPECEVEKELEKSGFCKSCENSFMDQFLVDAHNEIYEESRSEIRMSYNEPRIEK